MSTIKVNQYALILNIPVERLVIKLIEAGVGIKGADDFLEIDEKRKLLEFLRKNNTMPRLIKKRLKNTTVKRGGLMSNHWSGVYKNCDYLLNVGQETLDLSFFIPSKGGGETHIVVEISKEDISELFNAVVEYMPTDIKLQPTFNKNK